MLSLFSLYRWGGRFTDNLYNLLRVIEIRGGRTVILLQEVRVESSVPVALYLEQGKVNHRSSRAAEATARKPVNLRAWSQCIKDPAIQSKEFMWIMVNKNTYRNPLPEVEIQFVFRTFFFENWNWDWENVMIIAVWSRDSWMTINLNPFSSSLILCHF